MRAQTELFQRELERERQEIHRRPEGELQELVKIYESRGISPDLAAEVARQMMSDPKTALETHAREELGIHPDSLGRPISAAAASFVTFSIGALLPLIPFLVGHGTGAVIDLDPRRRRRRGGGGLRSLVVHRTGVVVVRVPPAGHLRRGRRGDIWCRCGSRTEHSSLRSLAGSLAVPREAS